MLGRCELFAFKQQSNDDARALRRSRGILISPLWRRRTAGFDGNSNHLAFCSSSRGGGGDRTHDSNPLERKAAIVSTNCELCEFLCPSAAMLIMCCFREGHLLLCGSLEFIFARWDCERTRGKTCCFGRACEEFAVVNYFSEWIFPETARESIPLNKSRIRNTLHIKFKHFSMPEARKRRENSNEKLEQSCTPFCDKLFISISHSHVCTAGMSFCSSCGSSSKVQRAVVYAFEYNAH